MVGQHHRRLLSAELNYSTGVTSRKRQSEMEKYCPQQWLQERGDIVFVAEALSRVSQKWSEPCEYLASSNLIGPLQTAPTNAENTSCDVLRPLRRYLVSSTSTKWNGKRGTNERERFFRLAHIFNTCSKEIVGRIRSCFRTPPIKHNLYSVKKPAITGITTWPRAYESCV